MPYFGREQFIAAEAKGGLDSKEYLDALANNQSSRAPRASTRRFADNQLRRAGRSPGQPAWLIDFIKGDASGGGFTSPAAVAGYPHITVPAGFVQGLPCGISFVGTAWSEPKLIALAYAFEQATKARRAPTFRKTVNSW